MSQRKKTGKSAQDILGEVLRRAPLFGVADLNLPKEIRRSLAGNIENLRNGVLDIVAVEVSRVLGKIDLEKLTDYVLKNYSLRLEAKIELAPKKRKNGASKAKK